LTSRDIYDLTASRPRLKVNDEGEISVLGGSRRVVASLKEPAVSTDVPAK
jgi:hypothetical protein